MGKNAVEEVLEMRKTAGPGAAMGSFGKSFGQYAGRAATGALAGGLGAAAAGGIGMAVSKIVDAATKSHDFKEMLAANEDLHEHYSADPKKFNMMFSTLRTMNPQFSKDPLVAGAYMRRMVMSPTGIGGVAGEALSHRESFENPMMEMFSRAGGSGAQEGLKQEFGKEDAVSAFGRKKEEMEYGQQLRDKGVEESTTEDLDPSTGQANKVRVQTTRRR